MRKPAIPSTNLLQDRLTATILGPMKENIEILTGLREGLLAPLPSDATLAAAVSKINEIIARLNAHE